MKQILQNLKSGVIELAEIPVSKPGAGQVLIQSRASLISPGTERMLVEFAQANLLDKARQQPERVKQALDKIKTDGLMPTLEAIFRKLDEPMPLGYCNAGVVLEVGNPRRGQPLILDIPNTVSGFPPGPLPAPLPARRSYAPEGRAYRPEGRPIRAVGEFKVSS